MSGLQRIYRRSLLVKRLTTAAAASSRILVNPSLLKADAVVNADSRQSGRPADVPEPQRQEAEHEDEVAALLIELEELFLYYEFAVCIPCGVATVEQDWLGNKLGNLVSDWWNGNSEVETEVDLSY